MPQYQIIFYVKMLFCVLKTFVTFLLNGLLSQSCRLRVVLIKNFSVNRKYCSAECVCLCINRGGVYLTQVCLLSRIRIVRARLTDV